MAMNQIQFQKGVSLTDFCCATEPKQCAGIDPHRWPNGFAPELRVGHTLRGRHGARQLYQRRGCRHQDFAGPPARWMDSNQSRRCDDGSGDLPLLSQAKTGLSALAP